jgi:hypothetical protein
VNCPPGRSHHRVHGWAWVGLTLCLALHVLDEASHDFLSLYNPIARRIRQAVPLLPIPVFTFRLWLTGLIGAIVLLLGLSPFVQGASWTRGASYAFGTIMLLNGCSHILGSIYSSRLLAGTYSAPLLVLASLALIIVVPRERHERQNTGA